MNVVAMLTELRTERERLTEAIVTIERLALTNGAKRRGRPPKFITEARRAAEQEAPRKRKPFSAATRKRMAIAQKQRLAKSA